MTLLALIALCLCFTGRAQDTIPSSSILFHSGQYHIRPSDVRGLKQYTGHAGIDSPLFVLIEGHSDSMGNYARNKLLSLKRAMAVKRWLVRQGIGWGDIIVQAWGPDRPAADNRTPEGRRRNRRVEIHFSRPQLVTPVASDRESLPDIAGFYQQIGTPLQKFCINPYRDTVIRCNRGTVMYIKAGSFVVSPGCDSGCVSFHVREDFLYSDMIMDDLSTTSDGRILETQGMIYTEAVDCNGKKLDLQKGKDMVVFIPTDTINAGAKVFEGHRAGDSVMNWKADDDSKLSNFTLRELDLCMNWWCCCIKKNIDCQRCRFFFCRIGRIGKAVKGVFNQEQRSRNREFRKCQKNLSVPPPIDKAVIPSCQALEKLFKQYGVDNVDSLMKAINQPLLDSFKLTTISQLRDTLRKIRTRKIELDYMKNKISFDDLQYYIYNVSGLGWRNIDCFAAFPSRKIVTVRINIEVQTNIDCKMVFKDRRVVLPPNRRDGRYEFQGIPKGERAVIVAIKYENGQPLLAMKEIIISEDSYDLDWKSLSLDQLKQELKKLDQ